MIGFQNSVNRPILFYFLLQPFGINDTIGCYLDLDHGSIKFSKNGNEGLISHALKVTKLFNIN